MVGVAAEEEEEVSKGPDEQLAGGVKDKVQSWLEDAISFSFFSLIFIVRGWEYAKLP